MEDFLRWEKKPGLAYEAPGGDHPYLYLPPWQGEEASAHKS
jgi:hypothetical protein